MGLEYLFIETNGVEFLRALNSDLYFHISVPVLVSVLLCTQQIHTHTHSGVLRTANFPTHTTFLGHLNCFLRFIFILCSYWQGTMLGVYKVTASGVCRVVVVTQDAFASQQCCRFLSVAACACTGHGPGQLRLFLWTLVACARG